MEIVSCSHYNSFVLGNALDFIAPLPRDFDGRFDGLSTCAGGQNYVIPKELSNKCSKLREDIIVEGSTGERQP